MDRLVENFFIDEMKRVEKTSQELIVLLSQLNSKILKLISMYQQKFKEEFIAVKENYERFQDEIHNRKFFYLFSTK
jgi:hypothetical protein